jgi:hypothetical protein
MGRLINSVYQTNIDFLEVFVIGGIATGLSFWLFEHYTFCAFGIAIASLFLALILKIFVKKEKVKCPHCEKIIK